MIRVLGTIVTVAWLISMAALIQRDVLPFWRAQDPPTQAIPPGDFQMAITNDSGQHLGTAWVTTTVLPTSTIVHSTTGLDTRALSGALSPMGEIFWDTDLTYGNDQSLDEFTIHLDSIVFSARVMGVRYNEEFACTASIGGMTKSMSFDRRLSKYLGDSFRPFTHLKGLHVGQSWRLRLIDPLALLRSESLEFTTRLVEVKSRETIQHRGEAVACFRIETIGTIAWANEAGRILRQEVRLPLLGTWIMAEEPFDEHALNLAESAMMTLRTRQTADSDS